MSGEVILSTVWSISNFTYLERLQLYLSGMAPNFTYMEWLNYHTLMLKRVLFDQQAQRKLSEWDMEAHILQWFILLNGWSIRTRFLLFCNLCEKYIKYILIVVRPPQSPAAVFTRTPAVPPKKCLPHQTLVPPALRNMKIYISHRKKDWSLRPCYDLAATHKCWNRGTIVDWSHDW